MKSFQAGKWVKRDGYQSFEPSLINRPWMIDDSKVLESLSRADRQLGRLDMFSEYVPGSRTTTSAGTTSGVITPEAGVAGATSIGIKATANWMWINNVQFSYSRDVVTEQVPEPSKILLTRLAALGFLRRRRA